MSLEDIVSWILKVAVVPLFIGLIQARDSIRDNRRDIKDAAERLGKLEAKSAVIEKKVQDDSIEYHASLATIKSVDTLIDIKLTAYFKELADQRHKDYEGIRNISGQLEGVLREISVEMKHLKEDVKEIKASR